MKKAKKKLDGVHEVIARATKLHEEVKSKEIEIKKQVKKKVRKLEWYEKFRWFISSEGFLCVGGRDSMSNEILARSVDHQRVEGPFSVVEIWSLTPNIARAWSRLLITRLSELSALYPSRLRRLQERSGE